MNKSLIPYYHQILLAAIRSSVVAQAIYRFQGLYRVLPLHRAAFGFGRLWREKWTAITGEQG